MDEISRDVNREVLGKLRGEILKRFVLTASVFESRSSCCTQSARRSPNLISVLTKAVGVLFSQKKKAEPDLVSMDFQWIGGKSRG